MAMAGRNRTPQILRLATGLIRMRSQMISVGGFWCLRLSSASISTCMWFSLLSKPHCILTTTSALTGVYLHLQSIAAIAKSIYKLIGIYCLMNSFLRYNYVFVNTDLKKREFQAVD